MRGLPGSGKTHMSRMLRELETQHSADAPRIHGIDDYFVTVWPCPFPCSLPLHKHWLNLSGNLDSVLAGA